jgi:hypothetical protein
MIVETCEVLRHLGMSETDDDVDLAIVQTAIVRAEGFVRSILQYDPVYASRTEYYPQDETNKSGHRLLIDLEDYGEGYLHSITISSTELQLRYLPIRSITSVHEDTSGRFGTKTDSFASDTELESGEDYWGNFTILDASGNGVCKDGILRRSSSWPDTPGSVKVIYSAGYSAEEFSGSDPVVDASPIFDAVLSEALRLAKTGLSFWKKNEVQGHLPGVVVSEKMGDYSYQLDSRSSSILFGGSSGSGSVRSEIVASLGPFINYGWCYN